jgi:hypothetical protein
VLFPKSAAIRAAALIACLSSLAFPAAAGATTCAWSVVASPNAVPDGNILEGVSADSATDAWAVGYFVENSVGLPLAEHWNGTRWTAMEGFNVNRNGTVFQSVAALNPTLAWAVGYYSDGVVIKPVIERWNGTKWTYVPSPSISNGLLFAVAAVSANDIWAVGYVATSNNGNTRALIEHWNGTTWANVPATNRNSIENDFLGVSPVNASDIWIGGIYAPTTPGLDQTLTEYWNGTRWTIVPSPDINANSNNINAIGALSATSAFAAGDYYNSTAGVFQTSAEVWNGKKWTSVPTPNEGKYPTVLAGLAAVSTTEVLAVGDYYVGQKRRTYAMRWNGAVWSTSPTPNVSADGNFLTGAAKIPQTADVWAVGGTNNADQGIHTTLIERYLCK